MDDAPGPPVGAGDLISGRHDDVYRDRQSGERPTDADPCLAPVRSLVDDDEEVVVAIVSGRFPSPGTEEHDPCWVRDPEDAANDGREPKVPLQDHTPGRLRLREMGPAPPPGRALPVPARRRPASGSRTGPQLRVGAS